MKRVKKKKTADELRDDVIRLNILGIVVFFILVGFGTLLYFKVIKPNIERQAINQIISEAEAKDAESLRQLNELQIKLELEEQRRLIEERTAPREKRYYDDVDLLANLICSEVGNEGEESMWNCGSVVLNRVGNHQYPDSVEAVIYDHGQYEVTWNGGLYKENPPDVAYEIAAELLNSGSILPENVIYQAEFRQGSGVYGDKPIGHTYYCYE